MAIEYRGERFAGYNKPKRTPGHPEKSHAVLAKEGDQVKLIRFGQQGVSGSPARKGESEADKRRRASFKARHAANITKAKCPPLSGQTRKNGRVVFYSPQPHPAHQRGFLLRHFVTRHFSANVFIAGNAWYVAPIQFLAIC